MLQGNVLEMGIFSEHAPYYYNSGLWVIPCDGKKPLPVGWSEYCDLPPSRKVRDEWLARYPDANVGLPLGSASGLVVVDTDDPDEIDSIKRSLPPTAYERIGQQVRTMARLEDVRIHDLRPTYASIDIFLTNGGVDQ